MKKTITTAILTIAASFGFAQEASFEQAISSPTLPEKQPTVLPSIEEKVTPKKSFIYIQVSASETQVPSNLDHVIPGIGLGYRLASGFSALDLSASYNERTYRKEETEERTFRYTALKANYLFYVTPARSSSLYAGGGIALGGMRTQETQEFHGIIPNVAIGYEVRNPMFRTFVQFDVSQPAVATSQKGDLPAAFAELTVGAGF